MDSQLRKALMYMVIASFCFAVTGAIARLLKSEYSSVELVLFRNVIGIPFLLYSIYKSPLEQVGGKPFLLFFRGFIGTMALYFFFYGVTTIGLPEAITYQQSYPIFLALISALYFGQPIGWKSWVAILLGFAGICMIFVPKMSGSALELKSNVIGISNLIMTGVAYLSIRGLSEYYDKRTIVLSFMLCGILFPILSLVVGQYCPTPQFDFIVAKFYLPKLQHLYLIVPLGLVALIGQVYLTKAFSHKNTGIIGAMGYTNVVFSILLGVLIGDALPDLLSLSGIIIIVISGVLISLTKTPT
jgi:drug/metabolite transporter (DMT)-like permease